MNDESFKKFAIITVIITIGILVFFIIKPIFLSLVTAVILAYIFNPVFKLINKKIRIKSVSAFITCVLVILILVVPIWFFAPVAIKHTLEAYRVSQQIDYTSSLEQIFPQLFTSEEVSTQISTGISTLVTRTINSILQSLANIFLNLPLIFLHLIIIIFTFYYALKDQDVFFDFLQSLSPFSKETERKFVEYSKGIAGSVIYGQVVVGIIQGLIVGFGLFIFQIPNFLFLTLIAVIVGVLPIVGPPIIWIPAVFYLFLSGKTGAGIGMLVIGIFSSLIDHVLRTILVSRRTKIPSSIILIGMIGGFLLMGVIGFILGPLALAYLLIILELFKRKDMKNSIIEVQ